MYDAVRYKKPFLKEVIFRVDFGASVGGFARALPQRVATAALKQFPLAEPQQAKTQEIRFSPNEVQTRTEDSMQWVYHGRNREKTLTITPALFLVVNRQYVDFEAFRKDLDASLNALFEAEQELSIARVGLRYVNVIEIADGGDPLAWAEFVNEEMLGIIELHKDVKALARAFHIVEFNYDGQQVKYQFGIANPDYPAPIKRKQFVLDIDSFFTGALTRDEVFQCIDKAHEKIQGLFEESITDKTRALMR